MQLSKTWQRRKAIRLKFENFSQIVSMIELSCSPNQGSLTEGEGSVQLTTKLK
jgi:hypothetical protein